MRMVVVVAAGLVLASCARELALVKGEMPVIAGSLEGGAMAGRGYQRRRRR